jgi:hypothetical protein
MVAPSAAIYHPMDCETRMLNVADDIALAFSRIAASGP